MLEYQQQHDLEIQAFYRNRLKVYVEEGRMENKELEEGLLEDYQQETLPLLENQDGKDHLKSYKQQEQQDHQQQSSTLSVEAVNRRFN